MNRKPDMNDSAPSVSTSTAPLTTRRWLRVTTLATALVIALGAIAYAVNRATAAEDAPAASAPPAPKVTVAPVEEKLLTEYEELIGRVDAAETVELRARVSGHLDAVSFQSGQLVKKGDVLFTIDPRWYRAQFDLATAHAELADREARRADALAQAPGPSLNRYRPPPQGASRRFHSQGQTPRSCTGELARLKLTLAPRLPPRAQRLKYIPAACTAVLTRWLQRPARHAIDHTLVTGSAANAAFVNGFVRRHGSTL